ncbi:MAG: NAD(P)-dependent oxidoreductase [Firmicutes bacterium]|nr:NAD(P)-dependent oxidoreductase [Bacillota bacterium]
MALVVAMLGLGEAGSAIAQDLVARSVTVRGWDPVKAPPGEVVQAGNAQDAVSGADVVLSVNTAAVALEVASSVADHLSPGTLYADLNTGAPELKRAVARAVEAAGALFVDVALMAPVPGRGIATPVLVSGQGAARFAELFAPLGMSVEVVDGRPGSAASRKLLRSVVMKGMAAAVIEGLRAAQRFGCEDWYMSEVRSIFAGADEALVERLISGSRRHAVRRSHEMRIVSEMLLSAGVHPRISMAAAEWLKELSVPGQDGR